jgi:hypothetical protein
LNQQICENYLERPINGNDIVNFGIKKGPAIGQILKLIDDKLLENPFLSREEALEIAKEYISLNKKATTLDKITTLLYEPFE